MKPKKRIPLLSIILFFILIKNGYSQEIILSAKAKIPLNITTSMEIFKDSTAKLPFEQIPAQNFKKLSKDYFIFPYSNNVFWVKLRLKNTDSKNTEWILQWINPLVEQLDFYISDSTKQHYSHTQQKLITSQKERILIEEEPKFSFNLGPNDSKIVYIKITSQRGEYGTLMIHSNASLINKKVATFAEQSFTNGLIVFRLFLIVTLAIFIIRVTTFRLYSLQTFFKTLTYWGLMNVTGPIFTANPDIAKKIDFLSYNTITIPTCMFVLSAIAIERLSKWNVVLLYFFIAATVLVDILAVVDYKWYWLKAGLYLIVFSSFYILFLYAYSIFKKIPVSKYYSIPFILGMVSYLLINLRLLGWLEYKPLFSLASLLFVAESFVFVIFLGQIFRNEESNKLIAEQQLGLNIQQNTQLKELDNLKTTFFANISHELRTPLTLIAGPIQELLQRYPSDNLLPLMQRNTQRLLTLINQLLDISKLEAGQMKLEISKQNITKYFRTLTSSFTSLAESRGIQFEIGANKQDIEGYIDRDKVDKIITNLLSNAFKFIPNDGKVSAKISYGNDLKTMTIEISDTGIGIQKEKLDKIFDRFYQVDSSQNRKFEGTGIGLALVKELVDVLKGSIRVTSQENVGTTFTVELPIDFQTWKEFIGEEKTNEQAAFPQSTESLVTSKRAVLLNLLNGDKENILLIVDDNEDIRSYIRSIFEKEYQIFEAVNGKEGVVKATEKIPNLIISDLMMPEMDGFEFCKILKSDEKTSHIPIIMLTAKANIESRIEGFELGADDYLIKPFNAVEIQARVKNLLDKQEKLRLYFSGKSVDLKPNTIKVSSMEAAFMKKVKDILEKHFSDNNFGAEQMSQEMNISQSQLLRKLKALTNLTINELIRDFRLQRAADLLKQQSATVSEVAYQVGFESLPYFSKVFQEKFGKLPSEI